MKTEEAGIYWKAKRVIAYEWLGVDEDTFYNSGLFAVNPLWTFYFQGMKIWWLPPRKGFAEKWHLNFQGVSGYWADLLIGHAQAPSWES